MSTFTRNYGGIVTTLANYRAMGDAVMDALAGFGWVQTADSGQVTDWSLVGAIPTTPATANFIVFTNSGSTDAMPVYVKISFWIPTTTLCCVVELGTGTTGAGVLTGKTIFPSSDYPNLAAAAGVNTVYACGDADCFVVSIQENNSNGQILLAVDASRDATGVVTADYYYLWATCSVGSLDGYCTGIRNDGTQLPWFDTGSGSWNNYLPGAFDNYGVASMAFNGNIPVSPIFPFIGLPMPPTILMVATPVNDSTYDTTITASLYGTAHTYRGMFQTNPLADNSRILFLWE